MPANNSGLDGALFLANLETTDRAARSFSRMLAERQERRRVDMTGAYNDLLTAYNRQRAYAQELEAKLNAWKKAHQSLEVLKDLLEAENQALRDRIAKWE